MPVHGLAPLITAFASAISQANEFRSLLAIAK